MERSSDSPGGGKSEERQLPGRGVSVQARWRGDDHGAQGGAAGHE